MSHFTWYAKAGALKVKAPRVEQIQFQVHFLWAFSFSAARPWESLYYSRGVLALLIILEGPSKRGTLGRNDLERFPTRS